MGRHMDGGRFLPEPEGGLILEKRLFPRAASYGRSVERVFSSLTCLKKEVMECKGHSPY